MARTTAPKTEAVKEDAPVTPEDAIAARIADRISKPASEVTRLLWTPLTQHPRTRGLQLAQELRRLDALLLVVWTQVVMGDAKAIETALKISERRTKLLGLDVTAKGETPRQEEMTLTDARRYDLRDKFRSLADHCLACREHGGDDVFRRGGAGESEEASG